MSGLIVPPSIATIDVLRADMRLFAGCIFRLDSVTAGDHLASLSSICLSFPGFRGWSPPFHVPSPFSVALSRFLSNGTVVSFISLIVQETYSIVLRSWISFDPPPVPSFEKVQRGRDHDPRQIPPIAASPPDVGEP